MGQMIVNVIAKKNAPSGGKVQNHIPEPQQRPNPAQNILPGAPQAISRQFLAFGNFSFCFVFVKIFRPRALPSPHIIGAPRLPEPTSGRTETHPQLEQRRRAGQNALPSTPEQFPATSLHLVTFRFFFLKKNLARVSAPLPPRLPRQFLGAPTWVGGRILVAKMRPKRTHSTGRRRPLRPLRCLRRYASRKIRKRVSPPVVSDMAKNPDFSFTLATILPCARGRRALKGMVCTGKCPPYFQRFFMCGRLSQKA